MSKLPPGEGQPHTESSPKEKRVLSRAEIRQNLELAIPAEERTRIDTEVPKSTILEFRSSALRTIGFEAVWLERNVHMLDERLALAERTRKGEDPFLLQDYNAHETISLARRVQINLDELKLHMAEYKTATALGGGADTEETSNDFVESWAKIEEYVKKTEGHLQSNEIIGAKKLVDENGEGMQKLSELSSYKEIRQPLPKPKSLTQDQLGLLEHDLSASANMATTDIKTGEPASTAVKRIFSNWAYRDLVKIQTLEQIRGNSK